MPHFTKLFKSAALPLGKTMYVYGGGWNKADNGAGKEAKNIGISKKWEKFFEKQPADYDYKQHLYKIHNGLDCSGYMGFCLYNTFENKNNKCGYVTKSKDLGLFLQQKGYGYYTNKENVNSYFPGDIMCAYNHVYMVLGCCEDKSILLIHSSPPGVQVNGTVSIHDKDGKNSIAHCLADSFMKNNFPCWYAKFPPKIKSREYIDIFGQFRWHKGNNCIFSGILDVYNMSINQILDLLIV